MQSLLMPFAQGSQDTGWRLAPGEACSWQAPAPHLLEVVEGRLWVAHRQGGQHSARDVVLRAGETLRLTQGDELVMEGWPAARFEFKRVRERPPAPRRLRFAPSAWLPEGRPMRPPALASRCGG